MCHNLLNLQCAKMEACACFYCLLHFMWPGSNICLSGTCGALGGSMRKEISHSGPAEATSCTKAVSPTLSVCTDASIVPCRRQLRVTRGWSPSSTMHSLKQACSPHGKQSAIGTERWLPKSSEKKLHRLELILHSVADTDTAVRAWRTNKQRKRLF